MNIKRFTYWVANLFLVFSLFLLNTSQPARAESAARQILPVMGTTPRTETLYFNGL
jgi:preprotein translocase subunit SecG